MSKEVINKIKPELEKVIEFLDRELAKIRTGRASVSFVEDIIVDCFGSKMPLKQLGAISCPEPRQILIQPWDKSYMESIERALSSSNMGASPVVDKDVIRLTLPSMTEDFRKNMARVVSEKTENARQSIRRWREQAWKEIQEGTRAGKIREDDKFRAKDELQDLVEEYNKKIDALGERKKKELEG
ncbi:MAG: ribosome recycling factor [bacterium]|nr:ribosome recycling factor [bacterium]